jgi:hypothetical protein
MGVVGSARRFRRRGWTAGAATVLLAVAVSGCGSSDNKQASSRKAATTAPTTTTAVTTTVPPPTTAPSTERAPTEPSTDATTETTEPPPVCVNSTDPRCGDFRWEPSPSANQPITIDSVVVDPPHPIAGQTVTVTIQWSDPDADVASPDYGFCDGNGCNSGPIAACAAPRPGTVPTGPWTLPPRSPGAGTLVRQLQFPIAGTFTWSTGVNTNSSTVRDFARDHAQFSTGFCSTLPDPYGSYIEVSDSITVLPESPPFPTIPQ